MGKKAILSHLSAPPILPFIPYLSLSPLSFLPFIPPLPFFALYAEAHHMSPKYSYRRFHRELRFLPLSRRMALGSGCGGRVWGYFKSCFLVPLSCSPTIPFSFFSPPSSLHATVVWCCGGMWGQGMGGGGQSVGCQYFLVKCSSVKKQGQCWQRAVQISAVLMRQNTLVVKAYQTRQLQIHGFIWKEQKI